MLKLIAAAYCKLLKDVLDNCLNKILLSLLIFMHDNTPSHSSRATYVSLGSDRIQDKRLIVWPPDSPELNAIENIWSRIKQDFDGDGRHLRRKISYQICRRFSPTYYYKDF